MPEGEKTKHWPTEYCSFHSNRDSDEESVGDGGKVAVSFEREL